MNAGCPHNHFTCSRCEEANLRTDLARLGAERDEAVRSREHTVYWYACRHERLRAELSEHGKIEPRAYHAIMANGTAESHEPPTYAQQLNLAIHRADQSRTAALREAAAIAEQESRKASLNLAMDAGRNHACREVERRILALIAGGE